MLNTFFEFSLNQCLKKGLRCDPLLHETLLPLQGKTIIITALLPAGVEKDWVLQFKENRIDCPAILSSKADLRIWASPKTLLELILKNNHSAIKMEGDVILAQSLQKCLNRLPMNWENYLSDTLGETLSYPVISLLKKGRESIEQWNKNNKTRIADYLQEDTQQLPLPEEIEQFCSEVDELKLRADRLEALWEQKSHKRSHP